MARYKGERVVYASCRASGCGNPGGGCPLKVYVKDGVITAIEPGDLINQGMLREDVGEDAIRAEMIQMRNCSRAYAWPRTVHHPDRARYPMKRVGERREHRFVRISWDEALDTIATKMKEIAEKNGLYRIYDCGHLKFSMIIP